MFQNACGRSALGAEFFTVGAIATKRPCSPDIKRFLLPFNLLHAVPILLAFVLVAGGSLGAHQLVNLRLHGVAGVFLLGVSHW